MRNAFAERKGGRERDRDGRFSRRALRINSLDICSRPQIDRKCGAANKGQHEAILDKDLFDAVQARRKRQAVEGNNQRRASPSVPAGKIFDDQRIPMTQTHANKKGVRWRYDVSQALLQGRKTDAGSVGRISAPDAEWLIVDAIRASRPTDPRASDRDVIERRLASAVIRKDSISIELREDETLSLPEPETNPTPESNEPRKAELPAEPVSIRIPFTPTAFPRKGVVYEPSTSGRVNEAKRVALLAAIANAKGWIDTIPEDSLYSFKTIAAQELAENVIFASSRRSPFSRRASSKPSPCRAPSPSRRLRAHCLWRGLNRK